MSNYICDIRCAYRQPSGYCGATGGYQTCQYRMFHNGVNTAIGYIPPIKKTNAERIRSMTDEELCFFLFWYADGSGKTKQEWLDWLKQEKQT